MDAMNPQGHRDTGAAVPSELPLARELAALTAHLAELLLTHDTVDEAVQSLANAAKDAITGASGAGASLIDPRGRKTSSGATDAVVLHADSLQYELGEGPCLSAWAEQRSITMSDSRAETRWPGWTQAVAGLPLRSALSTPLMSGDTAIGALKVYSTEPDAFTPRDMEFLTLLARPAALMLANVQARDAAQRLSSDLTGALSDRDAIQRAVGIMMEREDLAADQALSRIVALSRLRQRAVRDTALDIVQGRAHKG
ncbi:GAF and ANTAR domain-containing protein [Sinomonas sp. R1AF57]|uniref:GAF and ANTAR domain-containing protein n=1 Tax=Sinomonas sp. R1AF57 TaxID=2020377 RepID=UPI000B5F857F|nr:GAF and ANTAR domain-containing protein [Sinomonas sp. R1AF57]ASN53559.1 histidine kinase [Sinomonas sp. R1AF57]